MSGHCLCIKSSREGQFLVAALPKMGSSEQEQHLEGGTTTGWSLGLCDRAPEMLTTHGASREAASCCIPSDRAGLKISFIFSAGDKASYLWEWKFLWHGEEAPRRLPWKASRSLSVPWEGFKHKHLLNLLPWEIHLGLYLPFLRAHTENLLHV